MKKMNNKKVTFFAFLIAIALLIGCGSIGKEYEAIAAEFPYYGTLDIQWKGWKAYNAGMNYNLTGGTSGTLRQGNKLKVINEKKNASGNMVSYCFSEDLGRYCYVTSKYIVRTESEEETVQSSVTQSMEEQYGKDYYSLFDVAPEFLCGSVAESYELKCLEYCRDVFDKQDKSIGASVFWEVLANGKNIIWNESFAAGGVSASAEEKNRMEAAKYLVLALYDNTGAGILSEVNSNTEDVKEVVEWLNAAGDVKKEELIEKLKKAYKNIPENVVEEYVGKQFDISSLDTAAETVAIAKEVLATLEIYTVELNVLERLQGYAEPTSRLYQDLELVRREVEKDPLKHIMSYGTTEVVKGVSEQLFEKMLGSISGNVVLGLEAATTAFEFIRENIYRGADIGEYAKTAYLMSYYWELESVLSQMKTDIIQKDTKVTYKEIERFEELYFVKNRALHAVLEYCKGVDGKSAYGDLLSADIVTYETYIKSCMKNYYEAGKKVVLDVPLYTQTTTYTCGVSNVKMILDYLGIKQDGKAVSENTLWNWANLYNEGTYVYRVAQTLRKYGAPYQYVSVANDTTEEYWNRLESSLKSGCPIIVLIYPEKNEYWKYSSGHYVLVTGIYEKADKTRYAVINDCHFKYGEQGKEVPLDELLRVNKRHSSYVILGNK